MQGSMLKGSTRFIFENRVESSSLCCKGDDIRLFYSGFPDPGLILQLPACEVPFSIRNFQRTVS